MTSRVVGTGSFLPKKIINNDFLSTFVETNDEWITARTGIRERRIATEETTAFMASRAALQALESAKLQADCIDLIIVATFTPDHMMPNTACEVQTAIQAPNALCFDLNAACSGFLFAMQTAHAYIQSGLCKTALVIGAETLSKTIDWSDRGTCILFGDGAGAAILSSGETGIHSFVSGSDGSKGEVLTLANRPLNNPFVKQKTSGDYLRMDGQEVFKFAVRTVSDSILTLTQNAGLSPSQVNHYLLHQANKRIIQAVAKRLHVDENYFPLNLIRYGNTSAASLPILLDEQNRAGAFTSGDYIIMSGFGGGLTWGNVLMQW